MQTPYFKYQQNQFFCEGVPLVDVVQKHGTPLFVYSLGALNEQFQRFNKSFEGVDHLICYSMKANSSLAILRAFINQGSGIDVVTMGELQRALLAGCPASKIVFAGVGKQDEEIEFALKEGILQFNVESEEELEAIDRVGRRLKKKAPIALRVNPDVDPKTHAYISTGLKKSKFGVNHKRAVELYLKAKKLDYLEIVGMDCHIGSQLTTVSPFIEAIEKVKGLISELKDRSIPIGNLDLGGGLGIVYKDETPPTPEEYAKAVREAVKGLDVRLIFEPGRFLVGNSGVLLTKVIYNKAGDTKNFIIIDGASNNLMRPALYGAYHSINPLVRHDDRPSLVADVVGPICETGDFLALDRQLTAVKPGEYLAFMSAGAYGFSMSSTYNSRPRCAEVMVNGSQFELIREAEKIEDLTRGERLPAFLKDGNP